jgi:acyl-CoA dehydrogenase
VNQAEPIFKKIKIASQSGQLPSGKPEQLIAAALKAGVIRADEAELLHQAEALRQDAIQVDSFTLTEYQEQHGILNTELIPPSSLMLQPSEIH